MDPNSHSLQSEQLDERIDERTNLAQERTLLAAERTFLAWIRTGLTSIGLGVALARLIVFANAEHQHIGHLIGQLLIMWGICTFGFALISYRRSCYKIAQLTSFPIFLYQHS